ncbi:hypothetical protein C9374_013310 [Naegleria lovaniensis]|uniref:PX domain-containing protein n=1 Tax=Naegleria lovaniensis TaxID=51637 RepID=A0AA88KVB3_NAELO|nr:uncharacterized protein C9374_013310 [Naegleria lovaniensis]KAG2391825.1 hypothetical protein C9374_013310 [Naegleria lovaniensis]
MMKEATEKQADCFSPNTTMQNSSAGSAVGKIVSVSVGDPMKEGKGLSAKTTYLLQTEVALAGFPEQRMIYNSRKRYTEFKSLYDECKKLVNNLKSSFPPKSFKKFNDKLIEERRQTFESIITEIVDNPVLLNNSLLKNFLAIPTHIQLVHKSPVIQNHHRKFKFSTVLKVEEIKFSFKQFLIEEHNIEPFEFLESIYQIQTNGSILVDEFDRLVIEEFVEIGSVREINVDNKTRSNLLTDWNNLKESLNKTSINVVLWEDQLEPLLAPVCNSVKLHLKNDSFSRFSQLHLSA